MRMNYLLSRLVQMLVVLAGVSVLVFVLTRVLPGDPVAAALGDRATPEQMAQLRTEMGLDLPLWQQYGNFVGGLFSGDMGMSLVEKRNVSVVIAERLPATLELIFTALLIAIAVGVRSACSLPSIATASSTKPAAQWRCSGYPSLNSG